MNSSREHIFITGFPGFIGKRLVNKLLSERSQIHLHLLVHPSMESYALQTLDELDPQRNKTTLYMGDITHPTLGIEYPVYKDLAEKVTSVYHLAALYHLGAGSWLSYKVNVKGTIHILDLCERSPNLQRLNYVSTCYVAGKRRGTVMEEELDCGQRFRNFYESTKFMAEVEVRKRLQVPTTIIRPAIVVGDSNTGEMEKYDGPYYAIQQLALLEKAGRLSLAKYLIPKIGRGSALLSIVPVNYIVDSMVALAYDEEAEGRCFQLVDPTPMTINDFMEHVFGAFGVSPLPVSLPQGMVKLFSLLPTKLWNTVSPMPLEQLSYMDDVPQYDSTQARQFLDRLGVKCPTVSEYIDKMISYVRANPQPSLLQSTPEGLQAKEGA